MILLPFCPTTKLPIDKFSKTAVCNLDDNITNLYTMDHPTFSQSRVVVWL